MSTVVLGRLALVLALAATASGCMRMKMVGVSQPTLTNAAEAGLKGRGRIAVHVGSESPDISRDKVALAVKKQYTQQLAASGFEIIDIAQAQEQDLVLRANTRYFAQRDDEQLPLSAITLFIIPITGTSNFFVDTALIRNNEVLGAWRQALTMKYMFGLTPLPLLYGTPLSVEAVEPHILLNAELIKGAVSPAAGKRL